MNNKSLRYFLMVAVTVIWGLILYKVIAGLDQNDNVPVTQKTIKKTDYTAPADSFILLANYPDPFIPGDKIADPENTDIEKNQSLPASTPPPATIPPQPAFDIATIQYHGMIANTEKKKKVAMISIGGREYVVKENDRIEKIKISKISTNKIDLVINGKIETIDRKSN